MAESRDDALRLRERLERHVALTGSAQAKRILANWDACRPRFWKVMPKVAPAMVAEPAGAEAAAEKVAD